jgi:hypothetical protein
LSQCKRNNGSPVKYEIVTKQVNILAKNCYTILQIIMLTTWCFHDACNQMCSLTSISLQQVCYLPMKAFGIVILSHILSRISSPESGRAMARTMVGISVFTVSWISSKGPVICTECNKPEISKTNIQNTISPVTQ